MAAAAFAANAAHLRNMLESPQILEKTIEDALEALANNMVDTYRLAYGEGCAEEEDDGVDKDADNDSGNDADNDVGNDANKDAPDEDAKPPFPLVSRAPSSTDLRGSNITVHVERASVEIVFGESSFWLSDNNQCVLTFCLC